MNRDVARPGRRGFTLVEIMMVVLIIGLLVAVAFPGMRKIRMRSQQNACLSNMSHLQAAKELWAMEEGKGSEDVPVLADLAPYLRTDVNLLTCPAGQETYEDGLGAVEDRVACPNVGRYPGHVLPVPRD